jgi:hypothetical protein
MVMSALEGCTCLETLITVACKGLVSGELVSLELSKKEQGFSIAYVPYLKRNKLSLVALDMRW